MESPNFYYTSSNSQFTPETKQFKSSAGDNFAVEDLLDFSNDDDNNTLLLDGSAFHGNSTDSSTVTVVDSSCCNSSFTNDFGSYHNTQQHSFPDNNNSHLSADLCVPYDDIAELEWLSNFVEESFSSEDLQKLQLISGMKTASSETKEPETETNRNNPIFRTEMIVPGKARSKRSRAATSNWSSRLLVLSPTTTTTTTTTTTAATSSSSESDIVSNSGKKITKTPRKKEISEHGGDGRKCLHCATDKTPQWRTGPLGPKTLCNACGVRYKSGRLVPEYRPASSPTFVLAKHSNSHRKVLELRRQKEMQRSQQEQFLYPNPLFDISGCGADDYLIHHQTGSDFTQLI